MSLVADLGPRTVSAEVDWQTVARLVLTSRAMDRVEEERLVPEKKVLYQFSARGHDMAQVLLGLQLKEGDGAFGYYRSRPLLLALGVPLADALGSGMGLAGGYSDGRDIGVVFNFPNPGGAHALPMCGGVGAQYTPAAGWAQAIAYKQKVLSEGPADAISLVLGGDASAATGGFWSALTIATTQQLPLLIYIEDNGYGISVPSEYQTPGKDIAANLASFLGLAIFNGDASPPRPRWNGSGRSLHFVADALEFDALRQDGRFTKSPHHGDRGWLALRLDDPTEADWPEIAELLESAYRQVIPRRLREHE